MVCSFILEVFDKPCEISGEWDDKEQASLVTSCLYYFPPEEEVHKYIASLKEQIKALKLQDKTNPHTPHDDGTQHHQQENKENGESEQSKLAINV
jgi:hypothetical protein